MIRFSSVRRLLGFVAFALSILAPLSAAPHAAPAAAWANLPPHPRLFATADQWQALRVRLALTTSESAAADPVSTRLFALIRNG